MKLPLSAPPYVDQVRLAAVVSSSVAVSVATAVSPSTTVNAVGPATLGELGSTVTRADSVPVSLPFSTITL